MVGAAGTADAVACARRLPSLRVGLHLVLADGTPTLPPERIPDLVDRDGRLCADLRRQGIRIFLRRGARKQLAAEMTAQFEAYRATGLPLDHVNAHHHFHLHPHVGALLVALGRRFGASAIRVPYEPPTVLDATEQGIGHPRSTRLAPWRALLARRVRREGLAMPDRVFGLAWSGALNERRLAGLLSALPDGLTEIYCHPATSDDFIGAAPGSRPRGELDALTSPRIRQLLQGLRIRTGGFSDFRAA